METAGEPQGLRDGPLFCPAARFAVWSRSKSGFGRLPRGNTAYIKEQSQMALESTDDSANARVDDQRESGIA